MNNLDILDKKILLELDKNSRQNYSKLAKKLNTSQQVITYRVNKLVEEGIITQFMTSFSTISIGFTVIAKFYIQFTGINKKTEYSIFNNLLNNKDVNWVCKTLGEYDLFTAIMVKNIEEVASFKNELIQKYGNYINNYEISFLQKAWTLPRNFLLNKKTELLKPALIHKPVTIKLSDIDKKIMREIVNNSRINSVDLSKKLNINVKTVISKIKEYEKKGIIQGYRININRSKLNLKYYKVFIKLRSYNQMELKKFQSYCLSQNYLIHFIENMGKYEYEMEMEMPNSEEMQELVKEMRNSYSEIIETIETSEIIEELKLTWLPKSF